MKIGILTQPLHTNYGGLLQAYALQTVLKRMGHEPWIIRRENNKLSWTYKFFRVKLFNILRYLLHKPLVFVYNDNLRDVIEQNTKVFISRYIHPVTFTFYSFSELLECVEKEKFEAYVVGSDQVWRPRYSPCITNFFLDFIRHKQDKVYRVAYAVSFGVDNWEYSKKETEECLALVKLFDAVSVRESSGIHLCKEHLGVDASHLLDPTMLLDRKDYEEIINKEEEPESEGTLFYYMLDQSAEKSLIVDNVAQSLSLTPFSAMPKLPLTKKNVNCHLEECIFPPVSKWLRAFMDAEMILTDSFHGCVLSIIFNKPFWVISNEKRGSARFQSLLSMYGLESRLITIKEFELIDWLSPINWKVINSIRNDWKNKSVNFLIHNLPNGQ